MKKHFLLTILFFYAATNLYSQIETEFSGYVYELPIYQLNNKKLAETFGFDKSQFINLTRTRLRSTAFLWDDARINIEYEATAIYLNSDNSFFLNSTQKSSRQVFDLIWTPENEKNFSVTHFIDRLSFRQDFDWGNFEIGRQRVQWGSGRIWNPTDLFNPINPATFYKIEKDGADIVSLKYIFGNFTDIDIVFNAREKFKNSNFGFRFRTNYNEYDISLMSGRFDNRFAAGIDFAGNLFDAGVRGEGIFSADENNFNDNFMKFILGADYQFTSKLYSVIEYHFNGEGKKKKSEYELMKLINNEIINLSRNYLHTGVSYQYHPLLILSLSNTINLNDGSGYIGLLANYSISDNFYLNAGTQILYGDEYTEYWYFSKSLYLQGEFYF